MRQRPRLLLLLVVPLIAPRAALAGPELYGSVAERVELTAPSADAALPTRDVPIVASLTELNVQIKHTLFDEKLRLYLDASAFLSAAGGFADRSADVEADGDQLKSVDEHEVLQARPFVSFPEAWARFEPFDHLVLTAGKKRITWGPGFAISPTDVVNPARDPTDPTLQRTGAVLAAIDVPFESFTFSAVAIPEVLWSNDGLPQAVLLYPDYPRRDSVLHPDVFPDDRDDVLHGALLLRGYALLLDTDLNAWVIGSNRFRDDFEDRLRFAFTFSRVMGAHEVHGEALLAWGNDRPIADADCAEDKQALVRCALTGTDPVSTGVVDEDELLPRLLLGWRYMPEDGSTLSVEYLYQADGYLRTELGDLMRLLHAGGDLQRAAAEEGTPLPFELPFGSSSSSSSSGSDQPLRVSFNPQRRHYLFLSWLKPQVADDFTLQASLIIPVEDLSALASGGVVWQAQEWLQLSLYSFVTVPSPGKLSAARTFGDDDVLRDMRDALPEELRGFVPMGARVGDARVGEFDSTPFFAKATLEARVFF